MDRFALSANRWVAQQPKLVSDISLIPSKPMAQKRFNYNESIQEIEQILERFRNEELDVDRLASEVKRATELISACRKRLTTIEEEVTNILEA